MGLAGGVALKGTVDSHARERAKYSQELCTERRLPRDSWSVGKMQGERNEAGG